MDSTVMLARRTVLSTVFLRCDIPASHPSAPVLGEERLGTGVAIDAHRVLTAHYLLLGASQVEVTGFDGKPRQVTTVLVDHETGFGLVGLDGPDLLPVTPGPFHQLRPGLPVFLVSCTNERERKGATGHISAIGPFEAFWEYMLDRAIMTTVINPGLAGAPLFDAAARLIGIVSLGLASVGRYSLAIPLELYLRDREELERGERPGSRVSRAWLGFYPQGYDGGVVLTGVVPGGPADRAGLVRGDLILSVDGQSASTLRELYDAIWKKAPGEAVGVQILRESALRVVEVVSGDRYDFYK